MSLNYCMASYYAVANIPFSFEAVQDREGRWELFEDAARYKDGESIHVKMLVPTRCWGYRNLSVATITNRYVRILWQDNDMMLCDENYKRNQIFPVQEQHSITGFLLQLFYTHAVRRQMIQLHCATIDDGGRGILFLGPSGIGKTTQAERWAQYRGSAIINGDIGFVQRTPAGYTAWGTPWHGSSPYCLNASVPVKALVVLKQAPQNALRELTGFEKVREVSGSVFYPTWLEDGMELCTDTLNHLLSDLPVYRLDNRADEEAVRLLAAEIDRIS